MVIATRKRRLPLPHLVVKTANSFTFGAQGTNTGVSVRVSDGVEELVVDLM